MIWYLDVRTGSDDQDGREPGTAFKTVQHAAGVAKSGDTIMIAPGAYEQNLPQLISDIRAAHVSVAVTGGH